MATSDRDGRPVYEVEAIQKRVATFRRGGLFGYTITIEHAYDDASDHLTLLGLGLLVIGIGIYQLTTQAGHTPLVVMLTLGAVLAGVAGERYRYTRNGPDRGTTEGESDG